MHGASGSAKYGRVGPHSGSVHDASSRFQSFNKKTRFQFKKVVAFTFGFSLPRHLLFAQQGHAASLFNPRDRPAGAKAELLRVHGTHSLARVPRLHLK